jgi:hypothetical protein
MKKNVTTIFIVLALYVSTANFVFADEKQPPPPSSKKGNFTKGNFSKKNAWSNNTKAINPPNPGGGGTATEMPISSGIAILLFGSFVYLLKRFREDEE